MYDVCATKYHHHCIEIECEEKYCILLNWDWNSQMIKFIHSWLIDAIYTLPIVYTRIFLILFELRTYYKMINFLFQNWEACFRPLKVLFKWHTWLANHQTLLTLHVHFIIQVSLHRQMPYTHQTLFWIHVFKSSN